MAVILKIPTLAELAFRQQLLADADTMQYNHAYGGTIFFPPERWKSWYQRWIVDPAENYFYRYVFDEALGQNVGEVAYHLDMDTGDYLCDVLIHSQYRRRGYGRQALQLLCEAARANGVTCLCDDIAIDNPSLALFIKSGFTVEFQTAEYTFVTKRL